MGLRRARGLGRARLVEPAQQPEPPDDAGDGAEPRRHRGQGHDRATPRATCPYDAAAIDIAFAAGPVSRSAARDPLGQRQDLRALALLSRRAPVRDVGRRLLHPQQPARRRRQGGARARRGRGASALEAGAPVREGPRHLRRASATTRPTARRRALDEEVARGRERTPGPSAAPRRQPPSAARASAPPTPRPSPRRASPRRACWRSASSRRSPRRRRARCWPRRGSVPHDRRRRRQVAGRAAAHAARIWSTEVRRHGGQLRAAAHGRRPALAYRQAAARPRRRLGRCCSPSRRCQRRRRCLILALAKRGGCNRVVAPRRVADRRAALS